MPYTRYFRHGGRAGEGLSGEGLGRGQVAEGLVRSELVVGSFPFLECAVERDQLEGPPVELVELLGVSALNPLDGAVEFRASQGEHEESDVSFLTGSFESGSELATAVDLACPDGEGHCFSI